MQHFCKSYSIQQCQRPGFIPAHPPKDRVVLEEAGCSLLYAPSVEEVYPPNLETEVKFPSKALIR